LERVACNISPQFHGSTQPRVANCELQFIDGHRLKSLPICPGRSEVLGMITDGLLAFSFRNWWSQVTAELVNYFHHMDVTQWMIISACGVTFGFLCLRGTGVR
jgi:hypothetical protein